MFEVFWGNYTENYLQNLKGSWQLMLVTKFLSVYVQIKVLKMSN